MSIGKINIEKEKFLFTFNFAYFIYFKYNYSTVNSIIVKSVNTYVAHWAQPKFR